MDKTTKFSIGFINCDELGQWTGELSVYTANMAKLYRNKGHKVHLFVKNNLPVPNNLKGIYIHFVKSPKRVGLIRLIKYRFNKKLALRDLYKDALLQEVKSVVDKGFIDVIDIPEKTGVGEALLNLNIPKTVSLHYSYYLENEIAGRKHSMLDSIISYDEKKVLEEADSYIAPSENIINTYRENNSISNTDIINYSLYPLENKFYLSIEPKRIENEFNILISTRYSKRKRLEEFLEIISKTILVKDYGVTVKITFVGLENKQFLNKLKNNEFYKKNIFYKNYQVRPKFAEEYSYADMVVLPSCSESFSYTLIEAMLAGNVTLVAKDSGNEEFVNDGETGFVFANNNFEHMVKIIDSIITKPKLRAFISRNAKEEVNKNFNYDKIYRKTKDAYLMAFENFEELVE